MRESAPVSLDVRPMLPSEVGIVIDYFHSATEEFLETLGVDPTRLPEASRWRSSYEAECGRPLRKRERYYVAWLNDDVVVGFSGADKLAFGRQLNLHLHIVDDGERRSGMGTEFVRLTAQLYFETFEVERIYCEPNALNTAPNRTLQAAGFRYVKTHYTVPGPLNFHQPVTRWVLERP